MKSNIKVRGISERTSRPRAHPKSQPCALFDALLKTRARALRLCSSCIFKSHTSQDFPSEGKHAGLVFVLDAAEEGTSALFLCHEICLFASLPSPNFFCHTPLDESPSCFKEAR